MLYWGGFSGSFIFSRVYNRALDIYLVYMLCLYIIFIHMSWNMDGFNHIKVEFFLMDYSLNVQTTCSSHVDGVIYLHLYVLEDN